MRIAVLSDIHGNKQALEAVIEDARQWGANKWLVGGDIVGYGADPEDCINIIRELDGGCVAGNHDWGAVDKTKISHFNSAARKAIIWTRDQLGSESCKFLRDLPLTYVHGPVSLCHANFIDPEGWEYVFTLNHAQAQFSGFRTRIGVVGHSHFPFIVSEAKDGGWANQVDADDVSWMNRTRFLINVGSVGQPRDGDPRACYLKLDVDAMNLTLARVAYDVKEAQRRIVSAGLPPSLAERLQLGR